MAKKKAEILAKFVQEMYVILFGVGLGNIIFMNEIDISSSDGIGYIVSAIFVVSVTIRYWLDWATYIAGEIRSTHNEFIIDFAILLNLLLLFAYFQFPKIESVLLLGLSILDAIWVINYLKENPSIFRYKGNDSRRWIKEKIVGIIIFSISFLVISYVEMGFLIQLFLLILSVVLVRRLSFRSVKKARGLIFFKASYSDLEEIVRIHNENTLTNLKRVDGGFLLGEIDENSAKEKLHGTGSYEYFIVKQSNNIVGFSQVHSGIPKEEKDEYLSCRFTEDQPDFIKNKKCHKHIMTVAVDNDFKNAGIGRFMYEELFE